jgi:cytochrome c oxidase subunit II
MEAGDLLPSVGDNTAQRRPLRRLLGGIALIVLALVTGGCASEGDPWPGFFPTEPVTNAGQATQNLYLVTFIVAVIVFVIVEGLLILIALRWRRRPTDDTLPQQTHGSNRLEILWTILPAVTVTALFIGVLITLTEQHQVSAAEPPVVVDVRAFQWQWTFDYAKEGLSFTGAGRQGPVMALPVGEPVRIRLHAQDVIHAFYVPQFLYKLDVIPGRVNQFDIVVEDPGTYTGQCAEFCGLLHYEMFFTVEAMSRADYDAWVVQQQQATPPPSVSAPPDATTVQVTSISVTEGYEPSTLTAPADAPWVVELTNADQAVPHDFAIRGANPDGSDWEGDPDAQGGESARYQPPQLAAGTYEFYCSLHPTTMVGTLTVGE